jgi:hypothetical protein
LAADLLRAVQQPVRRAKRDGAASTGKPAQPFPHHKQRKEFRIKRTEKESEQVVELFSELRAVLVKFMDDGLPREACIDVLGVLVVNGMYLIGNDREYLLQFMGKVWDGQYEEGGMWTPHPADNPH